MKRNTRQKRLACFAACILALTLFGASAHARSESPRTDPLPSWNEGATKQSILDFVQKTTKTVSMKDDRKTILPAVSRPGNEQ